MYNFDHFRSKKKPKTGKSPEVPEAPKNAGIDRKNGIYLFGLLIFSSVFGDSYCGTATTAMIGQDRI
jgi:hypothetical protein